MKNIISLPTLRLIFFYLLASVAIACPAQAADEIKHLSEGFGVSGRQKHPEYPLKLVFTLQSGNYLADVTVNFFQEGKPVGTIDSVGPWLFVDLQPGSYTIEASAGAGNKQGAAFTLDGQGQKVLILSWPHE